jgi:ADP-ribose pyrophosphatase YjhB (NUDIX family)
VGRLRRLAGVVPTYARLAWWGLVSPRIDRTPLVVVQAVVRGDPGLLLCVRADLRGWELPGGEPEPGEPPERAVVREVREETGVDVAVERAVGEWVRTGFRPHRALVYLCRPLGGTPAPSAETPRVAWFAPGALPDTLFPWYREAIADALAGAPPARGTRRERQGIRAIAAGLAIDLRMRWRGEDSSPERKGPPR